MRVSVLAALLSSAALVACSKETPKPEPSPAPTAAPVARAEPAPPPAPGGAARLEAAGQGYEVKVTPPEACTVGSQATAQVDLHPVDGYKVNMDFPTSLAVTATGGVDIEQAQQSPAEAEKFEEKGARFNVAFICTEPGDKSFGATFKFAVCTDTTCDPKREKLAWNTSASQ